MYIIAIDPWGSYVDGRDVLQKEIVESFAASKGFTIQETEKEPIIDMLNSPIKAWLDSKLILSTKEISLEELKEKFPAKKKKK